MSKRSRKKLAARKQAQKSAVKPSVKGEIIALIACLPFLLFGAALAWAGGSMIADTLPCTEKAQGSVTEVTKIKKTRRSTLYKAVYVWRINDEDLTDYFTTGPGIKEGKEITVCYNPDDPKQHYVRWHDTAGNYIVLVFGIIWSGLILLIMYCIVVGCRRERLANKLKSGG